LDEGCQDNLIANCRIEDLGADGIKVGAQGVRTEPETFVSRNTIRNNLIAHGGRINPGGGAIWIGHADNTVVEHNEMFNFYYTAISVDWT